MTQQTINIEKDIEPGRDAIVLRCGAVLPVYDIEFSVPLRRGYYLVIHNEPDKRHGFHYGSSGKWHDRGRKTSMDIISVLKNVDYKMFNY